MTKEKKVSSVRFEPVTSRLEMLNLAELSSQHDQGIQLVPSHESLVTYCQNCSFFEAGNKLTRVIICFKYTRLNQLFDYHIH